MMAEVLRAAAAPAGGRGRAAPRPDPGGRRHRAGRRGRARRCAEPGFADIPLIGLAKREEEILLRDARSRSGCRGPRRRCGCSSACATRRTGSPWGIIASLRAEVQKVSGLDGIPGIGPARRRVLLRQFGSLAALRRAGPEAIAGTPGLGPGWPAWSGSDRGRAR